MPLKFLTKNELMFQILEHVHDALYIDSKKGWICDDDYDYDLLISTLDILRERKIISYKEEREVRNEYDIVVYFCYKSINEEGLEKTFKNAEKEYAPLKKPIIKDEVLKVIAKKISEKKNNEEVYEFLNLCELSHELISWGYKNIGLYVPRSERNKEFAIKRDWYIIFEILSYLAHRKDKRRQGLLLNMIGKFTHPLTHMGNKEISDQVLNEFNYILGFSGYCVENYKVVSTKKIGRLSKYNQLKGPKRKSVFFENDSICYQDKKVSFLRGYKKIIDYLWENRREIRNGLTSRKGAEADIKVLQNIGEYKNEIRTRDAIKKIRKKARESGIPITIPDARENDGYILEVDYD